LNADDATDQQRFAEVFLPHLVDAFRLARWLAGAATPTRNQRQPSPRHDFLLNYRTVI
jgi:hypothetical protein